MLKYNLMMSLLLLSTFMSPNWWTTTGALTIMTLMALISLVYQNQMMMSSLTMTDMMSSSMICLSMLISALMLYTSTKILNMNNEKKLFMIMLLLLLLTLINAFSAANIFMFYIWFEASLIPTMMIILIWGYQPERMQASMYMMVYTIAASLPMLVMFVILYTQPNSTIMIMGTYQLNIPTMLSILLIMGFLVKLPMFLFHLWLPKAHVEAPIAGSMILAAILLKLGGYGVARLMIMLYSKIMLWSSSVMTISMIGGVLTSMICLRQTDLKSLIAYSSVGHMGLMIAGTMTFSSWGMLGTLLMMIAHGLCSSTMFSLANINYEMTHTRSMYMTKGMMTVMPTLSMWWFLFSAINMAAPPSINLFSEIILITSTMSFSSLFMILLMMITFLTGCYSLLMYSNTQHGKMHNFTSPMLNINHNHMSMIMCHFIPLLSLILICDFSMSWI